MGFMDTFFGGTKQKAMRQDQLDQVPVSINVLLPAEQDGPHLWHRIS